MSADIQNLPHYYRAEARARVSGDVHLSSPGLPDLLSGPPLEFGGSGDKWSPETLLAASIADCFVLSFRAIARASRLSWTSLQCDVEGTLERREGTTLFTGFLIHPVLEIPEDTDDERARRILQKAEKTCLITNSLSAEISLQAEVVNL